MRKAGGRQSRPPARLPACLLFARLAKGQFVLKIKSL